MSSRSQGGDGDLPRSKGFRVPADVQGAAKCLRALGETAEAAVGVTGAEDENEHLASTKPGEEPSLQQIILVKLALVLHTGNL